MQRALRPETQGMAGKVATASPVTHHVFLGNLVLSHFYRTCFWAQLSFVAQQLPHCHLLKVGTQGFEKATNESNKQKQI